MVVRVDNVCHLVPCQTGGHVINQNAQQMERSATQEGNRFIIDNQHLMKNVQTLLNETSNGVPTADCFATESTDFSLIGMGS